MVSTPLADPSGTIVLHGMRGAGPRASTRHDAEPASLPSAAWRAWLSPTPGCSDQARLSPILHRIFERIADTTRVATAADTCALLQLDPATGTLQPQAIAGNPLALPLSAAAMNPRPDAQPVRIDLPGTHLAGSITSIPGFGALLVAWNRNGAVPEPGTVELAARLAAAAIDQDRAGTLDRATWRGVGTTLSATGEAVIACDASGRLLHINETAQTLIGLDTLDEPLSDPAFIRALDLRDQRGLRLDPAMLPSARLRAGKPAPDLVASARHHRSGRQWLLLHADAIRDGHGRVSVVLTTIRDFAVVQRYGESHWLRSRIAEHLHQRPIDLAPIEHDIAAFLDGTCNIELAGETPVPLGWSTTAPQLAGMPDDPDAATTELRLACGHLHIAGPAAPLELDPAPAQQLSHAIAIPLMGDGEIHGHMTCRRDAHRPCFDQAELELLTELAEQIGLALAVSRLRASLHAGERLLIDIGQRLQDAEEAERRRMALSIHDGLAQVAASVCQQLEIIAHRFQPSCDDESRELQRARDLARRTVHEARQLIAGLRPVTLEAHGLGTAVREEIESLRGDGLTVRYLDGLNGARFPADIELEVFRVVQEALTNARKHAGAAPIEVMIEQRGTTVHFEVRDHGVGFDPSTIDIAGTSGSHVGLGGMRERIARLGGTIGIDSAPASGTRVKGDVPI